jgi:tRNA threonylcarbamoyladenosine biosynthesis protein TsaB
VAVGVGPGPFTGLRVGLVTARALGSALGVPVLGVCTLDVLAAAVLEAALEAGSPAGFEAGPPSGPEAGPGVGPGGGVFCVATDARRREVYWATYAARGDVPLAVTREEGPAVGPPGEVPPGLPVVGRGAALYPDALGAAARGDVRVGGVLSPGRAPLDPDAGTLARLVAHRRAHGGELRDASPLYLRRPDAATPGARKPVAAPGPAGSRP